MKVLVLGANGATGFNVVTQLLKQGFDVKALARNTERFGQIKEKGHLEIIQAGILEIDKNALKQHLEGVDAVISCLGHNISLKGIFGKPHTLVVDALTKTAEAIKDTNRTKTVKIILMNTTACLNRMQDERFKAGERFVMGIMRSILPPQRDNESALGYLTDKIGTNNKKIEWIAVRPDTLTNENEVTEYFIRPSPIRSPIFDAGVTSRINVADFMARLLKEEKLWDEWKFKTPVIYNKS